MTNKEIILLIISVVVVSFFLYLNFIPDTKKYYSVSTSDYTFNISDKSYSNSDNTVYKPSSNINTDDNNSDDNEDYTNLSLPSEKSNNYISVNNDNSSLFNTSDYNQESYSHNNDNDNSDILSPPIIDSYNYKKSYSSKSDNNVTAISITTDLSNNKITNSGSSLEKCTPIPTGCGHWVHHDGYYEWEGWHKVWVPPYDEWVSEPCPPATVPVGDLNIFEIIGFILVYVLYLKIKQLKTIKKSL